jgi:predicted ribosomally synthesized peptide with SipW-like signal peptide
LAKIIMIIAVCVALVSAIIGGATMAWYTDQAVSGQIDFAAGTVLVEANTAMVFGVERETGHLYEIDIATGAKYKIYETPPPLANDIKSPNGLAYDNRNQRLYFAVHESGDLSNNSILYFYDFATKSHSLAGATTAEATVEGIVAGACFGRGYFWYIKNQSDDLYKVRFDATTGYIEEVILAYENFTEGAKTFRFGDVAMDSFSNTLYGSTLQSSNTEPEFFKIDLTNGDYEEILVDGESSRLQLAFGTDSLLYGHSTGTNMWYNIDPADGNVNPLNWSPGERQFTDLASNWQNNWNPGDCDMVRYYISNVGTKDQHVRVALKGEWEFDNDDTDNTVHFWLCNISPDTEPHENSDWFKGPEGYFYYKHTLEPGEKVLLCVMVCLDDNADDIYQNQTYNLTAEADAVQATHGAAGNLNWEYSFTE